MRLLVPTLCAVAFASLANAAPQTPSATPAASDERCLLEMVVLSNSTDQNSSRMGQTGVIFFAGKVKGRDPNFDFARLKALAATLDVQSAQADLQQHCGPMLTSSMEQLRTALAPPASQSPPSTAPRTPAPAPAPRKP